MNRLTLLITALIMLIAPAARAQNLGNIYQNLYTSTFAGGTRMPGSSSAPRRASAPARWTLNPKSAAVIQRIVAKMPTDEQPVTRTVLEQTLASWPKIVQAASQGLGVTLSATDPRDAAALAGTLSYQELSGRVLTNAEFAAERTVTRRSFANKYMSAAAMQESGETYAMAIGLMGVLKAYADNPKNPNPDLTRQQLRDLAQNTFKVGYRDADYTKFAPTSNGIAKVR